MQRRDLGRHHIILNPPRSPSSTMSEAASREILTRKLANLLGFDDGADDVLEHLLTIESGEDLLDYLSQLLGAVNDDTKRFVDNVGRFQRGEEVAQEALAEEKVKAKAVVVTKPPASVPETAPTSITQTKPTTPAAPIKPKSQSIRATAKTFAPAKIAPKPKAQPAAAAVSQLTSLSSSSSTAKQKAAQSIRDNSTAALQNKPQRGQKGKAKFECGCFGNLHTALANCLHCGRISCQREGYDFCPFCEYLVEPVQPPEEGISEAWARKERLLQYERESAERTVVLDDQADHFSSQDSAWLTEEERADAKERSDARSDEMNHRKKVQLNIAL